ncbi:MAG: glycoside hydrolase 5 family protein [Fimbriimonadaceae bacterium]
MDARNLAVRKLIDRRKRMVFTFATPFCQCTCTLAFLGALTCAHAADNRLYVVNQSDFNAKRGFYVSFENNSADGVPCKLGTLRLVLGVADGVKWTFVKTSHQFTMGQLIRVGVTISGNQAELHVDEHPVGVIREQFKPLDQPLIANDMPGWATAPADYRLVQHSLRIQTGSTEVKHSFESSAPANRLTLFERPPPWSHALAIGPADLVTIDALVTVEKPATIAAGAPPFIDRYGQAIDSFDANKVFDDADIVRSFASERSVLAKWKQNRPFDQYGALTKTPWTAKATGFYRTVKHGGMWWLVTPLGTPCFYTGMCTAPDATWDASPVTGRESIWKELPPKTGAYAPAWTTNPWGDSPGTEYVGFNTVNLIRKFGAAWREKTTAEMEARLAAWGFSGLGKWSDFDPKLPSTPVLTYSAPRIGRHPDVFDPAIRAKITESLAGAIGAHDNDPNVVGWSVGNEYDEIITPDEVDAALKLPDGTPLKKALIAHLLSTTYHGDRKAMATAWAVSPPNQDREAMREFYATTYYAFLYKTVKAIDPNHLYLGFWIVPGWWVNDTDWSLLAPYCDVIGYDRYSDSFDGLDKLFARFDKPVLLGEFSYPPWYDGLRGFGRYQVYTKSERESGEKYASLMRAASKCPQCVGALWFQYRDEPLTGRGPGSGAELVLGEHYAFGFVDVADRPKMELVRAAREANLRAALDRLKATH